VREVRRPVQRVDDPFPFIATLEQDGVARFFGSNSVFRMIAADALDDELFRGEIGFRDEIDVAFFRDVDFTPELFEQNLSASLAVSMAN
jgi:hypothetical protein